MTKVIRAYSRDGLTWIRIFGFGLAIKDTRRQMLYFSERNGIIGKKIGRWHFTVLLPGQRR